MVASLDTSFDQNKLVKIMVCILALFGLFGPLFKKLGNFFPNYLVTLCGTPSEEGATTLII
jgi:hypothetical protein